MSLTDAATLARITALARSGALGRAWALLEETGLAHAAHDPQALSLRARLKKDRAKRASGPERRYWFEQSAADYLSAADISGRSYPLINAASLSLFAGRRDEARMLAQRTLDLIAANPGEAETPYWHGATVAEALLLLNRRDEAEAALRGAVAQAPRAWEDRAASVGQFTLLCGELGFPVEWLDAYRPPRSMSFSGIMGVAQSEPAVQSRIAELLDAHDVGFGYGALAAGADIWIAEALLARSAELHVILPCPAQAFVESSVLPLGHEWQPRFERALAEACTVEELEGSLLPEPAAVALTNGLVTGLAIHNARMLESGVLRMDIVDAAQGETETAPEAIRTLRLAAPRVRPGESTRVEGTGRAWTLSQSRGTGGKAGAAGAVQVHEDPAQSWRDALPMLEGGQAAAFDTHFAGRDTHAADAVKRLRDMLAHAQAGQGLAGREFAFSLLAQLPAIKVEPLGEIRNAQGFFPFYALVRSD